MGVTEQNFVRQMISGNEKALEYVMHHYGGLVKSVVHRYLYCLPQYEEECMNDIFWTVWKNISSYQPERNPFANWIAGVARIKSLDYKRKYAEQLRETSWDAIAFAQGSNLEGREPEPWEEKVERKISPEIIFLEIQKEFSEETCQMLECLKPVDRELFLKLYVEEQTMEEVSRETGIKKSVIYNRLSRAKKKMRMAWRDKNTEKCAEMK